MPADRETLKRAVAACDLVDQADADTYAGAMKFLAETLSLSQDRARHIHRRWTAFREAVTAPDAAAINDEVTPS